MRRLHNEQIMNAKLSRRGRLTSRDSTVNHGGSRQIIQIVRSKLIRYYKFKTYVFVLIDFHATSQMTAGTPR